MFFTFLKKIQLLGTRFLIQNNILTTNNRKYFIYRCRYIWLVGAKDVLSDTILCSIMC